MSIQPFGERLAKALELAGKRQGELAAAIGMSKQAISNLLNKHSDVMKAENMARAARYLQVDWFWLATGEGHHGYPVDSRPDLTPRALYVAERLDAITDPAARDRMYALLVQILDFGATAARPTTRAPALPASAAPPPRR